MTNRSDEHKEPDFSPGPDLDIDVSYIPAFWHTLRVSHLTETDIDRISRSHGLSIADIQLLGAVRGEAPGRSRATDLAQTLRVSNAVISTRVAKLERNGLIEGTPSAADRRAVELSLTQKGRAVFEAASVDIEKHGKFVRCYRRLSEEDRSALTRIMGDLHNQLYRDFSPKSRGAN